MTADAELVQVRWDIVPAGQPGVVLFVVTLPDGNDLSRAYRVEGRPGRIAWRPVTDWNKRGSRG